jgi:hypothetical protein
LAVAAQPVPVCPRCQTPNNALGIFCNNCRLYLRDETANIYIVNIETGRVVGAGEVWLRDVVLKIIVAGIVPFGNLIDPIWILIDRDRQALHDKIIKTVVVYAPAGVPESMQQMTNAPLLYQAPGIAPTTTSGSAGAQGVTGTAEQLRELRRLRDENILTEEEYERKRAELAGKL